MHWIEKDDSERKFWQYVTDKMGLVPADVYEALGVARISETDKSKEQVVALLKEKHGQKERDILEGLISQVAEHKEARSIAYMDVYTPDGNKTSITAREGVTADTVAATALALAGGWEILQKLGWGSPKNTTRSQAKKNAAPNPAGQRGGSAPPAPKPAAPAAPPQAASSEGGTHQTETVKITAPSGKPVVEFWRPGRKYSEIRYQLGGEALLKLCPALAGSGWTAAHFDAIGEEYTLPLTIHWIPSPKNAKWQDIVSIEMR